MHRRTRNAVGQRQRAFIALVALLLALGSLFSTAAQHPNGAGLVVRHGDGTLVYAYVQFEGETINGIDLLSRSGLDVTVAPFGGLGGAVCSINGEGCPSDNCFCHSYSSPSFFWHYYVFENGGWVEYPVGASSRQLADGDIDGWSWTAGESGLPIVSIDEIAAVNGIDRSDPTPTPQPLPTDTPTPEPLPTNTPPPPPTDTPVPLPRDTPSPLPTATSTQETVAVIDPTATTTRQPTATATATPSPTPAATATATATRTLTLTPTEEATATAVSTPKPVSRAVIVTPGATPVALVSDESSDGDDQSKYLVFLGMAAVVVAVGGFAVIRNRASTT